MNEIAMFICGSAALEKGPMEKTTIDIKITLIFKFIPLYLVSVGGQSASVCIVASVQGVVGVRGHLTNQGIHLQSQHIANKTEQ